MDKYSYQHKFLFTFIKKIHIIVNSSSTEVYWDMLPVA